MPKILRDAGLADLLDGELSLVADGFQFTEGPLWLPDDDSIIFQDLKADRTYKVDHAGQLSVLREGTNAANGQTFGPAGLILVCEQNGRRVSVMQADGKGVSAILETWQGQRLNSPNDIVCRSDTTAYFTDPPYGVAPADRALHFQGVYALQPGHEARLIADDFEKPNGLAFSPDESILYICDTWRYHIRAFEVASSGDLVPGTSRVFATFDPGKPGGPDGMKVDRAGRIYVAVALGVWVYESDGTLLGILELPERPSNLAWCGPAASTLAITAVDKVYKIALKVEGCPPALAPK